MNPPVQFAEAADGVKVAYWFKGDGTPLVYLPPTPRHAEQDWEHPPLRSLYEWLSSKHRLVRIDARNTGLSTRGVENLSLEARQLDVHAVCERLALEQVVLFGHGGAASTAISFAAYHPDRVRQLILVDPTVGFVDVEEPAAVEALRALVRFDWKSYTDGLGAYMGGFEDTDGDAMGKLIRASQDWEDARRSIATPVFASGLLPYIPAPTLVVRHDGARLTPVEAVQRLTEGITGANLVLLDGPPFASPDTSLVGAVDEFLVAGESVSEVAAPSPDLPMQTRTVVFADIYDSTGLTEQLGDEAFHRRAMDLDTKLRETVGNYRGTPLTGKLLGDGVASVFESARDAIRAALDFVTAGRSVELALHVGVHSGDVILEDGNVFGGVVNIAARISASSEPDEVLVSGVVRDMARTSAQARFGDRGERQLKGIAEPVRLFAVTRLET